MPEEQTRAADQPAQNQTAGASSVRAERQRTAEILAIADRFDLPREDAMAAIADGTPLERFRAAALDAISSESVEQPIIGMRGAPAVHSRAEQPYSLVRAIAAVESGRWDEAGFEREVAEELRQRSGRAAQGGFVPIQALGERNLLTTANAGAMIGTDHLGEAFVDVLRPVAKVIGLGATTMPGLRGNVEVPKMTAGATAAWVAEGDAAAESTPTFTPISMSLKQLSARARMSRRQLKQSDPSLEMVLRRDLLGQIGSGLDRAAIQGAGSATEPEGILSLSNLTTVDVGPDGDNGGEVVFAAVAALIGAVEANDIVGGNMAFVTNPKVKGQLLGKPIFSYGSVPMLAPMSDGSGDGMLANHRCAFTTNVPSTLEKGTSGAVLSAMIFGRWADLMIGSFGGIDVIVDQYSEAASGNVAVIAHSEWDIAVRYEESFAAITDIDTSLNLSA